MNELDDDDERQSDDEGEFVDEDDSSLISVYCSLGSSGFETVNKGLFFGDLSDWDVDEDVA